VFEAMEESFFGVLWLKGRVGGWRGGEGMRYIGLESWEIS
jgi:hypothetical protein